MKAFFISFYVIAGITLVALYIFLFVGHNAITSGSGSEHVGWEEIDSDRGDALRSLYMDKYRYGWITDSIEEKGKGEKELGEKVDRELALLEEGACKMLVVSAQVKGKDVVSIMYAGKEYYFVMLFSDEYMTKAMNLRFDKDLFEKVYAKSRALL